MTENEAIESALREAVHKVLNSPKDDPEFLAKLRDVGTLNLLRDATERKGHRDGE